MDDDNDNIYKLEIEIALLYEATFVAIDKYLSKLPPKKKHMESSYLVRLVALSTLEKADEIRKSNK